MVENKPSAYDDYKYCLSKYTAWIKEQIAANDNNFIRVSRAELAKAFSKELNEIGYKKWSQITYETIIRIILFDEGIFVQPGAIINGVETFMLRNKQFDDKLVNSLLEARMTMKRKKSMIY